MNRLIDVLTDPGVLAMLFLLGSLVWMLLDQKDKARAILCLAMLVNVFYGVALAWVMRVGGALVPWKFDRYLYAIDAALGVSAAGVARALGPAPALSIVYSTMIPVMVLWYAIHRRQQGSALLLAFAGEMIMGPFCYTLLPACGPIYAWRRAWLHPADLALVPIRLDAPPNAFPSLHFGTSVVLLMFAAGKGRRVLAILYASATALATLTTGEHYVIDLVVAIPFACAAVAVAEAEFKIAAAYFGTVLVWLFAIRFATPAMIAHAHWLQVAVLITLGIGAPTLARSWHKRPRAMPETGQLTPDPVQKGTGAGC